MMYGLQTNGGLRSDMIDKMEKRLIQMGISPQMLEKGKRIENPRLKHYDIQCPICRAHFNSKNIRCPKCDIIVLRKRPTGTHEEQAEGLDMITESWNELEQVRGQRKKILREMMEDRQK